MISPYDQSEMDFDFAAGEAADLDAIYKSEAEAYEKGLADLRTPAKALEFLVEAHGGDTLDGELPSPVEVLEVLAVSQGTHTTTMTARVMCDDGVVRTVDAFTEYNPGSYDEPPYGDAGYEFVDG